MWYPLYHAERKVTYSIVFLYTIVLVSSGFASKGNMYITLFPLKAQQSSWERTERL